ncbi:MAG TPA: hypothetical protein VLJ21_03420 [Candidatus Binatia bacterium]|nr:hypothetical protein [Candidatus Binatia bacterium]
MRLTRSIILPIAFAAAATTVLAAAPGIAGLSSVGTLLGDVFGGMFRGISSNPTVWLKVILTIVSLILIYVGLGRFGTFKEHKGSRTVLSIVLAIAVVVPIPDEFLRNWFAALGAFGVVFYIIPVLLLIYASHKLSKQHGLHNRVLVIVIWVLAITTYLGGIGINSQLPGVDTATGIAMLVAIYYIISSVIRLVTGVSIDRREKDVEEDITKTQRDVEETIHDDEDATRASQEISDVTRPAQNAADQGSHNAAQQAAEAERIRKELADLTEKANAAKAEAQQKLDEARKAQQELTDAAEKERKLKEAQEAAQKAAAAEAEKQRKEEEERAHIQALSDSVTKGINDINNFLNLIPTLKGQITKIRNLENKVKRDLKDLEELQKDIQGLTDLRKLQARVAALNDAGLLQQFANLEKQVTGILQQAEALNPVKDRLKKHLDFYAQSRDRLEKLVARLQKRQGDIGTFTKKASDEAIKLRTGRADVAFVERLRNRLAWLTEWFNGVKAEFAAIQQMNDYQGSVARAINQDLRTWADMEARIQGELLNTVNRSLKTFEATLKAAEVQKKARDKQLGK